MVFQKSVLTVVALGKSLNLPESKIPFWNKGLIAQRRDVSISIMYVVLWFVVLSLFCVWGFFCFVLFFFWSGVWWVPMLNQVFACLLVLVSYWWNSCWRWLGSAWKCLQGRLMFCLPSLAVAQEFGVSQKEFLAGSQSASQVSSTVHVLSMLLRLRQCCCHLSLLKVVIALYCSGVGVFVVIFLSVCVS